MKSKILFVFPLVLMLIFSSCGKEEPVKTYSSDMLEIVNEEMTLEGCLSRYNSVMNAVNSKVTTLENEHNKEISADNPDGYFMEDEYILTAFSPFVFTYFRLTENFIESTTSENAEDVFAADKGNDSVIYSAEDNKYVLKFVNETQTRLITADYNDDDDSFRYTYSVETAQGEEMTEFLEFVKTGDFSYAIQSNKTRMSVSFDADGNMQDMYCSILKDNSYTEKNSIYDSTLLSSGKGWVVSGKETKYVNIYEFDGKTLKHKENSGGEINEIVIYAADYQSAFLFN